MMFLHTAAPVRAPALNFFLISFHLFPHPLSAHYMFPSFVFVFITERQYNMICPSQIETYVCIVRPFVGQRVTIVITKNVLKCVQCHIHFVSIFICHSCMHSFIVTSLLSVYTAVIYTTFNFVHFICLISFTSRAP